MSLDSLFTDYPNIYYEVLVTISLQNRLLERLSNVLNMNFKTCAKTPADKTKEFLDIARQRFTVEEFSKACDKVLLQQLANALLEPRSWHDHRPVFQRKLDGPSLESFLMDKPELAKQVVGEIDDCWQSFLCKLVQIPTLYGVITQMWIDHIKVNSTTPREATTLMLYHLGSIVTVKEFRRGLELMDLDNLAREFH